MVVYSLIQMLCNRTLHRFIPPKDSLDTFLGCKPTKEQEIVPPELKLKVVEEIILILGARQLDPLEFILSEILTALRENGGGSGRRTLILGQRKY